MIKGLVYLRILRTEILGVTICSKALSKCYSQPCLTETTEWPSAVDFISGIKKNPKAKDLIFHISKAPTVFYFVGLVFLNYYN